MRSQQAEIIDAARNWLARGRATWLCTVVAATGSAPRPPGSMLVYNEDGGQLGSLSGGCVEEDLLAGLQTPGEGGAAAWTVDYGISAEQNERLGLPCGGHLKVLVQSLRTQDQHWLNELHVALVERRLLRRDVCLPAGDTSLTVVTGFAEPLWDGSCLRQVHGPRMRIVLVGAGHLSEALAELALAMDYEVLVTDPRGQQRAQWAGPEVPLLGGMPDDVVREWVRDERSLVITLTHDPRIDDMALMEALEGPAWYVGALGSRRTSAQRRQRLQELGLSASAVDRLHAPVGLDIGSKTPLEIAVAIVADLTRRQRRPGS